MKKILTALAATTMLSACNLDTTTSSQAMTEEQVKLIIDNYVEENPDKILEELQTYMEKTQVEETMKARNAVFNSVDELTAIKGAKDAPISIMVFSDFECPFCQRVNPTLESMLKRYDGKVRVIFKHLPLPSHANAAEASVASLAALKQNKFWEYHDEIFKHQQSLNSARFIEMAETLKLDMDKFKADLKSKELAAKVAEDMAQAQSLGIRGTPYMLINNTPLDGAYPEEKFIEIIEAELDNLNK